MIANFYRLPFATSANSDIIDSENLIVSKISSLLSLRGFEMVNVPTIKLQPTGQEMPLVGLGLWKITNEACADTVYNAIKTGYRLFDGAFGTCSPANPSPNRRANVCGIDYGNEKEAGQGVKRAIDEGLVKREDLFIVSKLWNTFHEKERVKPIAKTQLEWWGLEYFDLFLIHFRMFLFSGIVYASACSC